MRGFIVLIIYITAIFADELELLAPLENTDNNAENADDSSSDISERNLIDRIFRRGKEKKSMEEKVPESLEVRNEETRANRVRRSWDKASEWITEFTSRRDAVSPKAANMKIMKWSDGLAEVALAYAQKCIWTYNSARTSGQTSTNFNYVGESLYINTQDAELPYRAVRLWDLEKENYDYDTNTCSSTVCTSYTQIAWANTEYVGCASHWCDSFTGLAGWSGTLHVCNYGEGGNYQGQKPYTALNTEQETFLTAHQDVRANVDPAAANMQIMTWSEELEGIAREWAETCSWSHNPDRSSKSPTFSYVGENKYINTGGEKAARCVEYWSLEKDKYDFDTNSCSSGICTHYTQVVWHNSVRVGCAIHYCSSFTGLSGWSGYYHVCNYGPGGNYEGQTPYTKA